MNLQRFTRRMAGATVLLTLSVLPGAAHAQGQLKGAGATFPAPIYAKWFGMFQQQTNTAVDYQAVGSGKGYSAIKDRTVDFGASDAPLTPAEEKAMPGPVVHIPTVGGAVVLTYNLPGAPGGLHLTPQIIGGMFLGQIKNWNDPQIKAANPGVNLPDEAVRPVHRTDGSGTTYIFTNYLKKADPNWASVGAGKSVNWPAGLGGAGNAGVSANVKRTPGSIGYVELAYAVENKLPFAAVRNRAGKFIMPSSESTTAAIEQYVTQLKKDIKTPTVDATGPDSYPICSLTYILLYRSGGAKAAKLWSWAMQPAQQGTAKTLYYAPLPPALAQLNAATLSSLK
jgi:phosphate transport system substrate-binding protein